MYLKTKRLIVTVIFTNYVALACKSSPSKRYSLGVQMLSCCVDLLSRYRGTSLPTAPLSPPPIPTTCTSRRRFWTNFTGQLWGTVTTTRTLRRTRAALTTLRTVITRNTANNSAMPVDAFTAPQFEVRNLTDTKAVYLADGYVFSSRFFRLWVGGTAEG